MKMNSWFQSALIDDSDIELGWPTYYLLATNCEVYIIIIIIIVIVVYAY